MHLSLSEDAVGSFGLGLPAFSHMITVMQCGYDKWSFLSYVLELLDDSALVTSDDDDASELHVSRETSGYCDVYSRCAVIINRGRYSD